MNKEQTQQKTASQHQLGDSSMQSPEIDESIVGAFFNRQVLQQGVIPVVDKVPRIKNWNRGGLRAPISIENVFGRLSKRFPGNLAVGIPTGFPLEDGGCLLVVDVDRRNGGEEALAELPPLPDTAMARTKDGCHLWFRTDKPFPSTTRPDGIELKGAGAYVVVPPSKGKFWVHDPYDGIAQAPEWLIAKPQQRETAKEILPVWNQPITGETSFLTGPALDPRKGHRHISLLEWTGRFAARGWMSKAHALLLLNAALRVGLEHADAMRIINNIFSKEAAKQKQSSSKCSRGKAGVCIQVLSDCRQRT
jgi:hypothetical protein